MSFDVDLFVIGGGSGGVRAARIAASDYGAKVALAEESRMGGTCVIRGCVPKKLMVFAGQAPQAMAEARGYGWRDAQVGAFDWPYFRDHLSAELTRLEGLYTQGLERAGVTIHPQRARIIDPHEVQLDDGTIISAKHILVAVGGRPVRPDLPGADLVLVSDDLFDLPALPRRIAFVGGGFIACEFAAVFANLGCEVVQAYRGTQILRGFDGELAAMATDQQRALGIDLRLGTNPSAFDRADGLRVTWDDGLTEAFDAVVLAIGRRPNTEGLGLQTLGLTLADNGAIPVDGWSQTAIPSIFAVGDVTDRVNLTPVAIREGHAFADTIFGARPRQVAHDPVASAVYLRPNEVGTIGPTEDEAAALGPVDVYAASFRPMQSLFAGNEARSLVKLLVDPRDDRLIGCHIFAPNAGELIQLAAVAVTNRLTKAQFDATMPVHPTLAEELVTMRAPTRRHAGPMG